MKSELVNFETARLAKAQGFREPTLYYYDQMGDLCSAHDLRVNDFNKSETLTAAPAQDLLERWLRETYKLIFRVDPPDDPTRPWYASINQFGRFSAVSDVPEADTYEEVRENALVVMLKYAADNTYYCSSRKTSQQRIQK